NGVRASEAYMPSVTGMLLLAVVAIFGRNVVLGNFLRLDFALVGVASILNTAHGLGFERLTFFEELFNAFRVDIFDTRESLNIAGLAGLVCKSFRVSVVHATVFQADTLMNAGAPTGIYSSSARRLLAP